MIANTNTDMSIDELASKVMEGIKKSNRKLVENAALHNRSLIVGDDKGCFKAVPAKELLKKLLK
ncbi:hypothetical protein [Mucilaginibacter sp. FT3.2]|uniref:hypothetical protein n=1 Tax=Mucilaginibacter sp. FT3.2 TaxID=2723090 RepID=UPI001622A3FB|nr:hypothetical protein [Mucilaginibacter sp. FT3.2]MBB6231116.1 hypothetical protein [Mucilaginibacter sp. FT3.2]